MNTKNLGSLLFLLFIPFFNLASAQNTVIDVVNNEGLTFFASALTSQSLTDQLQTGAQFTVFAPVDSAFVNLGSEIPLQLDLATVLKYHVLPYNLPTSSLYNDKVVSDTLAADGTNNYYLRFNNYQDIWYLNGKRYQQLNTNWANIVAGKADIAASNGLVDVIDEVLIPPQPEDQRTILEEFNVNSNFTVLDAAFNQANLADVDLRAITAFAPTDDAFARLPPGFLTLILADPVALRQFLLYHLVNSTYFTVGLQNGLLQTLEGTPTKNPVVITVSGSNLTVNGVNANPTNIHRENGVIHVLDRVLFPPDLCLSPQTDGGKTLADASFWCHQFKTALTRFPRCQRYTNSELLDFVDWIRNNSDYFNSTDTLTEAKNIVCSTSTSGTQALQTSLYTLWLDVASANTFLTSSVADFCDSSKTYSWYKKKNYNYRCTRFYYVKSKAPVNPVNDSGTIEDALNGAENAILSGNRTLINQYTNYLKAIIKLQAPGASGCPNTCGASANAAYAISSVSYLFTESGAALSSISPGIAAVISSVVTAFVVIGVVALLTVVLRERVVKLLTTEHRFSS